MGQFAMLAQLIVMLVLTQHIAQLVKPDILRTQMGQFVMLAQSTVMFALTQLLVQLVLVRSYFNLIVVLIYVVQGML
jgi:hypothetical protein